MPQFYFHADDAIEAIGRDGVDLPDLNAAHVEAVNTLCRIVAQQMRDGHLRETSRVRITDEGGTQVGVATFLDAGPDSASGLGAMLADLFPVPRDGEGSC